MVILGLFPPVVSAGGQPREGSSMTPLRRRMVEDMKLRRFAGSTQYNYIKCVERFAEHFGRSPETMGLEDMLRYYRCVAA